MSTAHIALLQALLTTTTIPSSRAEGKAEFIVVGSPDKVTHQLPVKQ